MKPRTWLPGLAVLAGLAVLTFPFLWTRLAPDFAQGTVALRWAPENAWRFLSVVLPGFALGGLVAGAPRLWARLRGPSAWTARGNGFSRHVLERPLHLALLVVAVGALGFALSNKALSMGTFAALHMVLALGLNVTVGMTGILVLGFAAFFSAGAYAAALLQVAHAVPWPLVLPLGCVAAGLLGWLVGLPCLRLRGDYLAIVTLGFAEALRELVRNLDVTGGDMGLILPVEARIGGIGPASAPQVAWIAGAILVALCALAVHRVYHSRIGRAWIAIREDEIAAGAMGIPVVRLKLLAFAFSASLAGLAGAFFAGFTGFVDPSTGTFEQSVLILAMVILGGLGSLSGSLLGALLLYLAPTLLRDGFPAISDFRLLFFGALLVAMMLLRPQGLLGSPRHRAEIRADTQEDET